VTISCSDELSGCSGIWYTLDGSIPTTAAMTYSGPITLAATTTLRYMSRDNAGNQSATGGGLYTVGATTWPITVTVTGSGTVYLPDLFGDFVVCDGLYNNGSCGSSYAVGSVVTLGVVPNSGYTFTGWTGACSGTGACQITMDGTKNVEATFTDLTPPDTIITSSPTTESGSTSFSFTFSSSEAGSTFQCSYGGAWKDCTTPYNDSIYIFETWTESQLVFNVRAIDPAGNIDPTPASFAWTIFRPFSSIFDITYNGGVVKLQALDRTDSIFFYQGKTLTLAGGFDTNYQYRIGTTRIHGSIVIQSGTLIFDNITVM
jgi:uncharacterized repeat protein (TIGR02543 family)